MNQSQQKNQVPTSESSLKLSQNLESEMAYILKILKKTLFFQIRKISFRRRIGAFITNKIFEYFLFIVIICYTLLVFTSFTIEDLASSKTITNGDQVATNLKYTEIVILAFFLFEICCKIYVYGAKVFDMN